jgi:protein disulfide-isomerase A1
LAKNVGGEPAIQLFRSFDKPISIRGEELKKLKEFVSSNGYPLVEELSGSNFNRFVESGLLTVVLFADLNKKEELNEHIAKLTKIAESLKGKAAVSYTNGVMYKEQLKVMGGDEEKLPAYAAMDIQKRLNYPYSGEQDQSSVQKWIEGILSGEVKPFLKSQPIPEKQEGPVYTLVGKSFEQIVYDKTKDVLVEVIFIINLVLCSMVWTLQKFSSNL